MSRMETLSKANNLCRQLRNKLYKVPDGEEIEFMDEHQPWVSANEGTLPGDFGERWQSLRRKLRRSIQDYVQAQNMSRGRSRYQLTNEVADLRTNCWRVLKETLNEIEQELIEAL